MEIKIKKAKLNKNGTVEAAYTDTEGNDIAYKGVNKCHVDLKSAFSRLVPYFADLTEQKEADSIDWDNLGSAENLELLRKLDVTGVSIGGDDNNRVITLTGNRLLFTSRVLNLNSPGVEMDNEAFVWRHSEDFDIAVEDVLYEAKQYIVNRKWGIVQMELDFEGSAEDPFESVSGVPDAPPLGDAEDDVA